MGLIAPGGRCLKAEKEVARRLAKRMATVRLCLAVIII